VIPGMPILFLDLATKTGWAHSSGASGVWDLKIYPDESQGMRLIRFAAKLREVVETMPTVVVGFEAVTVGVNQSAKAKAKSNFSGVKLCVELQAMVKYIADAEELFECMSVNLNTIKAHALPHATTRDKAAMIAAAREKWPLVKIEDDNQADALWGLDYLKTRLALRDAVEGATT
jgi:hypothetical protein